MEELDSYINCIDDTYEMMNVTVVLKSKPFQIVGMYRPPADKVDIIEKLGDYRIYRVSKIKT